MIRTLTIITVLAVMASTASAGEHAPIVVESFQDTRSPDVASVLAPVYDELSHRGYELGAKLADDLRFHVSREPGALTPSQVVEAQKGVERAYQSFVDGDYNAASTSSERALALYATAPGVLAHEDALRKLQLKAMLIAARSAQVLGRNDDAFRWMAEAIRTFQGERPSAAEFDPKVTALYRDVRDELAKQGSGTLEVRVSDPGAVIFVDEHFVGTGTAKLDQLPPGAYRVYVEKGKQPGRVHAIQVAPGATATVDVSWEIDGSLITSSDFVGVRGPNLAAMIALAREVGSPRVVVLSIQTVDGRRSVVGYGVQVESQTRTYGAVQIEPLAPADETMHRLAALLSGDRSVSTSDLITREPEQSVAGGFPARRKVALVVGAAALVLGGVAAGFDVSAHDAYDASTREPNDARQAQLYETSNNRYHVAQGLAIVGGVGIAASLVLWFTVPKTDGVEVAPFASGDEAGVFVSGKF